MPNINPFVTTNAVGSFNVHSTGLIQGTAMDDPAIRYKLTAGILSSAESLPMWGGVGISETVSPVTGGPPGGESGGTITRASQIDAGSGQLTGFSVFDQAHAMVNFPQSPVPLSDKGGLVHYYRLGSGARIAVACDPALASLLGGVITAATAWDFTNQKLIAYSSGTALPVKVLQVLIGNSMTVSYNASTGFATWTRTGSCALILI